MAPKLHVIPGGLDLVTDPIAGETANDADVTDSVATATDALPGVDASSLWKALTNDLGEITKMSDVECAKILRRIYKILGKEEPRTIPDETRGCLVICPSNDQKLTTCRTVRETLREMLKDTLSKL